MLICVPLSIKYGISLDNFVFSKARIVQTANQIGVAFIIPFHVLYMLSEIDLKSFTDITNMMVISAGLLVTYIIIFYFSGEKIIIEWEMSFSLNISPH